jgi:hypothetical protein
MIALILLEVKESHWLDVGMAEEGIRWMSIMVFEDEEVYLLLPLLS